MQDFRIIYKILKILQQSMDLEEFDCNNLSAERLGLSEPKWSRLMAFTRGRKWSMIKLYDSDNELVMAIIEQFIGELK